MPSCMLVEYCPTATGGVDRDGPKGEQGRVTPEYHCDRLQTGVCVWTGERERDRGHMLAIRSSQTGRSAADGLPC